ncbi:MAG: TolC family protein [Pseudomonadota bacterium]
MLMKTKLWVLSIGIAAMTGALPPAPAWADTMTATVRDAVRNSPLRKAARADVTASASELQGTRSGYLPSVTVFGDAGGEIVSSDSLSRSDNNRLKGTAQVGVQARYTLFDGYARANSVYRAAARLDAGLFSMLAASETIALNAIEAYIDVQRHRQLLHIAKQNIQRHRQIERLIRERVAGGKSPASDNFQIEERILAARAVETEIKRALGEAIAKYRRVVGRSPRGSTKITFAKRIPRSREALVHSAIANNAEIKNNNKLIAEAEYARDVAKAGNAPNVFLEGRATAGANRSGTSGERLDAFVGLRLSWNLYDGGATDSQADALAARAGEAAYRRDLKIREIKEAAERAWNSYINGRTRVAILTAQVQANKKIVRNYREEYELSKRSLLDVLDAERARFNTDFQRISVRAAYQYAPYRMLATQSKLVSYFGASGHVNVAKPRFEQRVLDKPQAVFDIHIEPLK